MSYEYDLFISYKSEDRLWAARLDEPDARADWDRMVREIADHCRAGHITQPVMLAILAMNTDTALPQARQRYGATAFDWDPLLESIAGRAAPVLNASFDPQIPAADEP